MSGVDCIVIGGPANGTLLRDVHPDAEQIELKRPEYVKPLESSKQEQPCIQHEIGVYDLYPLELHNEDDSPPTLFLLAITEGQTLTWAFSQLVVGYIENETNKFVEQNRLSTKDH